MGDDRVSRIQSAMQRMMLKNGARLDSLDDAQILQRTRNNNLEGESYSHPIEGENIMNTNTNLSAQNLDSNNQEGVAPAGGQSDADTVAAFTAALRNPGSSVSVSVQKPYGRLALEAAIPTAVVAVGIVATAAACTFIDNKFGAGAKLNKLIDRGDSLDSVSKALSVAHGVPEV